MRSTPGCYHSVAVVHIHEGILEPGRSQGEEEIPSCGTIAIAAHGWNLGVTES